MATKGRNPAQEAQTSAIKPVVWIEGQGAGWGENSRWGREWDIITGTKEVPDLR